MTATAPAIVVIGATGYTGRLIAAELLGGDARVVLAARDPVRLERLATGLGHRETRVVDVTDRSSLAGLIGAGDVVVNTAGPFAELGEPVIRTCIDRRAHYLDTAGEQPFMRDMHRRYDGDARRAGSAIVNAMAFEFALGDCGAAVLARGRALPLRALDVAYAWGGGASSRGTRRTIVGILGRRAWSLRDGRWRRRAQGAGRRRLELASGRRLHAVAFGAGEVVTVPRHTPAETVRGWAVTGAALARLAPLVAPALPVVVPPLRPVLARLAARAPDPTPAERDADAFTIRLELEAADGAGAALEIHGRDPYGLTAAIAARTARALLTGGAPGGVLTPAQVVDPAAFLRSFADRGLRLVPDPDPG